ncbi:hypothetical protein C1I63_09270 [Rathayibacter caricis DSM 15933]|uniref:HTH luxR-type domain-containing protein n=1 Tax=Rathayibacter caricis DSM 15933 TaxID=1328867 RepID=A0A2T4UU13_9MICO|nr:hypothetical protein C1I63_09270 [Rathayibacter caricis DSM 15933]
MYSSIGRCAKPTVRPFSAITPRAACSIRSRTSSAGSLLARGVEVSRRSIRQTLARAGHPAHWGHPERRRGRGKPGSRSRWRQCVPRSGPGAPRALRCPRGGSRPRPRGVPVPETERLALTVVDGLAIDRAALLALLGAALPQFDVQDASSRADTGTVAVVDLDGVATGDLVRTLAGLVGRYRGVVALSTMLGLETVRAVLRFERSAFVWKGDDPGDLAAAVVSVSSGRTWISEAARGRFLMTEEDRRPVLSPQESRVMRSYGAGTAVKTVAVEMRIAEHTVRTYIKRIRVKYLDAGIALESRVDFYRNLDGHDVALRSGGDRMRTRGQQLDGDLSGDGAA